MNVFHSKVMLGLVVSGLFTLVTNAARADDPTSGNGYYQLKTTGGRCLGLEHESTNNGTQMEEAAICNPTNGAETQAWKWNPSDCLWVRNGLYWTAYCSIRSSNNKCLGTYGGSPNQGTYAVLWDCLGTTHTDQYWATIVASDGTMHIWNYKAPQYGLGYAGTTYENAGPNNVSYVHDQVGLESNAFQLTATPVTP